MSLLAILLSMHVTQGSVSVNEELVKATQDAFHCSLSLPRRSCGESDLTVGGVPGPCLVLLL